MDAIQRVGEEIRRVRMKMNMTQKEFGEMIGKSESQVGAYETAKTAPSVDILFRIAEVANVPPEELLVGAPEKNGWDLEMRVYNLEDRKSIMTILAVNGYDVGQHKRNRTPTGKTVDYFVHATDCKENADTSK